MAELQGEVDATAEEQSRWRRLATHRAVRLGRGRGLTLALVGLYWGFYAVLFCGSIVLLIATSLHVYELGRPVPGLSLANFRAVLDSDHYLPALRTSVGLSLIVSILCTGLGLITVLCIRTIRSSVCRLALILAMGLMFFCGLIPRTVASQFLLSGHGPLGQLMGASGSGGLLYSFGGVLLGYVSVMLPLALVVLYVARETVSEEAIEAARDLGASWWARQVRVVIPLMRPGVIVSLLLPFVLTLADVVVIDLLGGSHIYTAGLVIVDWVRIDDWGRAAAASVFVLVVSLIGLAAGSWSLDRSHFK